MLYSRYMKQPFTRSAWTLIFLSSFYSVALVGVRFLMTREVHFFFLIWNLALAWIPFLLAAFLWSNFQAKLSWVFWLLAVCWVLFLPNTFYMMTDLVHLQRTITISFWFDLVTVMSFVWNGLLLGLLSTYLMHDLLERYATKRLSWVVVHGVLFLTALGVYLGRFLGFNSWDIIANPSDVGTYFAHSFLAPLDTARGYAFVFFFYLFFALVYMTFRTMQKGLLLKEG